MGPSSAARATAIATVLTAAWVAAALAGDRGRVVPSTPPNGGDAMSASNVSGPGRTATRSDSTQVTVTGGSTAHPTILLRTVGSAPLGARIDLLLSAREMNDLLAGGRLRLTVSARGIGRVRLRASAARPDGSGVRVLSEDLVADGRLDRRYTLTEAFPALARLDPDDSVRLRVAARTERGGPTVALHLYTA